MLFLLYKTEMFLFDLQILGMWKNLSEIRLISFEKDRIDENSVVFSAIITRMRFIKYVLFCNIVLSIDCSKPLGF